MSRIFGETSSSIKTLPADVSAAWRSMLVNSSLTSNGKEWAHFQNYARRDSIAKILYDSGQRDETTTADFAKYAIASLFAINALQEIDSSLARQLLSVIAADYGLDETSDVALEISKEWRTILRPYHEEAGFGLGFFDSLLSNTEWTRQIGPAKNVDKSIHSKAEPAAEKSEPRQDTNISTELTKLSDLFDKGLLTQEEFSTAKSKLLGLG
jgi:hypothetical protein